MRLLKLLKSLWKYIKQDKYKLVIYITLVIIGSFLSLAYGYLFGYATQGLVNKQFDTFLIFIASYAGLYVFHTLVIMYIRNKKYNEIELNFIKRISKDLYEKAINLPIKAYDKHNVGEIINRIYNDPNDVISILSLLVDSIAQTVASFIVIIYAFTFSYVLGIEMIIFIAIDCLINSKYYPKIKKVEEEVKGISDNYLSEANQVLYGIRDVKGLGIKNIINKHMNGNVEDLYNKKLHSRTIGIKYDVVLEILYVTIEALVYITLGYGVVGGSISVATFVAYQWYVWRIFDVARTINQLGATYQKVIVALERISDILYNKLYEDEKFGNVELDNIKGEVEFKNITFGYEDSKKVLDDLSVTLKPCKKIAIVGKSGMGKTTLFNLLLRFYEPESGVITIDGVDIKDLSEKSLREHVAIIRQEPYIFNKTILENFKMMKEDITLEEVRTLCQTVYIDDYIMGLEKGYDTLIGEGGVNLSGGQKQRLSIARSLSKDSKIMLFDESTSSLDNESQAYIKQSIDKLVKDHTIIIVAHRLSTIVDADIILLMDEGKIIASGTHLELIKSNELYRKLYKPELLELNI